MVDVVIWYKRLKDKHVESGKGVGLASTLFAANSFLKIIYKKENDNGDAPTFYVKYGSKKKEINSEIEDTCIGTR